MKKFNYKMVSLSVICLALGQLLLAQAPIAPPPPVPAPEGPDKADQTEIVIRQKGDKDTKLTLEIKNGDYFINGKPLEKFDDQNVSVEKREIDDDLVTGPGLYSPSPFRVNPGNEDRMERDQ